MTTFAGRAVWPQPFMDSRGNARPGTLVTFYLPGTSTLATLYTDPSLTTEASNPAVVAADGNLWVYGPPGDYDYLVEGGNDPTDRRRMTFLPDPAEPVDAELADGSVTTAKLAAGAATGVALGADVARTADLDAEEAARIAADALLIPLTQKGAANGVATLDSATRLPNAQLPTAVSVTSVTTAGLDTSRSSMADLEVTAKPLRLQKIAGTSPVEGASAVGDKIALYSDTHGIGLQAGRVVVYMPASAALVVRITSATGNKSAGVDAVGLHPSGDVESFIAGKGVILMSPSGTRYRITVADDGALTTVAV